MHNVGSTDPQPTQRRYAEAWGWGPEHIEVIDDDLGLSGDAASHRPGYQRLLKGIEAVSSALSSSPTNRGSVGPATLERIATEIVALMDAGFTVLVDSGRMVRTGAMSVYMKAVEDSSQLS